MSSCTKLKDINFVLIQKSFEVLDTVNCQNFSKNFLSTYISPFYQILKLSKKSLTSLLKKTENNQSPFIPSIPGRVLVCIPQQP